MAALMFRLAHSDGVESGRLGGEPPSQYAPSGFAATLVTDPIDVTDGNTPLADISLVAPACPRRVDG